MDVGRQMVPFEIFVAQTNVASSGIYSVGVGANATCSYGFWVCDQNCLVNGRGGCFSNLLNGACTASRLSASTPRVGERLGGKAAGTGGPGWPKGCPAPYGSCSVVSPRGWLPLRGDWRDRLVVHSCFFCIPCFCFVFFYPRNASLPQPTSFLAFPSSRSLPHPAGRESVSEQLCGVWLPNGVIPQRRCFLLARGIQMTEGRVKVALLLPAALGSATKLGFKTFASIL